MVDRVSASITLGGALTASAYAELVDIITREGLSIEWGGERFEPAHRKIGEPLHLCDFEVAWGCFADLEAFCVENKLPFARWSGGYGSQWGAERVVFTGDGEPTHYAAIEEDGVVVGKWTVETLGSFDAIMAYFAASDFKVPPLAVEGDPSPDAPE